MLFLFVSFHVLSMLFLFVSLFLSSFCLRCLGSLLSVLTFFRHRCCLLLSSLMIFNCILMFFCCYHLMLLFFSFALAFASLSLCAARFFSAFLRCASVILAFL